MSVHTIKLDDFEVLYVSGLDGGGFDQLPDFIDAVGQKHYTNAVEWCAGFGVIGFDFLNKGKVDHISFIDCYEPATRWLNRTIEHNNIENKATVYLADKISLIPEDVKWDLVLANPPHSFGPDPVKYFQETVSDPQTLSDVMRITCDEDLSIHQEFFDNIRKNLLPDADIFISETGHLDTIQKLAEDSGLIFVNKYPAPMLSKDCKVEAVIFHFKEPL